MNKHSHIVNLDLDTHQAVQDLLPLLLAGSLGTADQALVLAHLQSCTQCQADLDWQRRLQMGAPDADPALDPDRALARMLPQLGPQASGTGLAERWRRAMAANSAWLRWTAAAQCAAIAVLALFLVRPAGDDGAYRALGAGAPVATQGNLVVMFKPDTSERELRRILQASGARLADGPTVSGAYVLNVAPARAAAALAQLRTEPSVTLAQTLDAERQPGEVRP